MWVGLVILTSLSIQQSISIPQQASAAANLRSLLSPAGQSAYDAASDGGYFVVSQSDYAAAFSGLSNMTKIGIDDATLTSTCSGWSANYLTVSDSTMNLPGNSYLVGFASGFTNAPSNSNIRLATSSSYKGTYSWLTTYTAPTSGAGAKYFLFKSPAVSPSTRYLGIWGSSTMCGNGAYPNGAYSMSGPPWSSFTTYTGNSINLQVIYSTSDQWTSAPPTITAAFSSGGNLAYKGVSKSISLSTSVDGLATFKFNGKNIAGCVSLRTISLGTTCNWKPAVQGSGIISITLSSSNASFSSVSSTLQVQIQKRANSR